MTIDEAAGLVRTIENDLLAWMAGEEFGEQARDAIVVADVALTLAEAAALASTLFSL